MALVTPAILSRAYHGATGEVKCHIKVSYVSMVDLAALSEQRNLQIRGSRGDLLWETGVAPALQLPQNMYAESGGQAVSPTSGSWLITANTNGMNSTLQLVGIRVAGGCEIPPLHNGTFRDRCVATFGDSLLAFRKPSPDCISLAD